MTDLPVLDTLDELDALLRRCSGIFVRYSDGPERDADGSVDGESGLPLPGLSANPLDPEPWWTRPREDWLARQLCQYRHLAEQQPERFAWVLGGEVVGRGPDCEPLIRDPQPVARLSPQLLEEAERVYRERFDRGKA